VRIDVSIVEDDSVVRQILAGWISQAPEFRCVSDYGSAADAMARLPKDKPQVVLMDINLPDRSGIYCVCQLKALMPATQFLMLTVYEDASHIFDALAAGATGYLLKRTPREELLTAIKQVNEGGSPMTSYIARKVVQAFQHPQPERHSEDVLSPREWEVLKLLARGLAYKQIADSLGITISTVNTYIMRIYEKLHVRSRGEAVARYAVFPSDPRSASAPKDLEPPGSHN
jgi:DNA-binding NarL/FixJ family response regulator